MAVRDYTARILDKRAKQTSFDSLDYTPIAIPAGAVLPETTQQTMARMMLSSGMINLDDYYKMIGVVFDGDYAAEQEDFGDETEFGSFRERFRQSTFAEYEDDFSYDNQRRMAPEQGNSDVNKGSDDTSVGGVSGNGNQEGQSERPLGSTQSSQPQDVGASEGGIS